MPLSIKTLLVLSIMLATCQQDTSQPATKNDGATLKGRLVQNDRKEFQLELDELATQLNQQVQLPQPELPANWKDLKQEQRQAWFKTFNESEAGKDLVKKRQAVLDSAASFELTVEEDGNFTVFDVPSGIYGLRGRAEKEVDGKTFVFEVFGQISIAKEVEEVLLDPIMVSVTRILKPTEALPTFKVPTFDGKATIQNDLVKDKIVLFSFWSLDSPPSIEFSKTIQAAYKQTKANHNVQLISVCVGADPAKALLHVKKNNILGWHGHAKDWQDPIIEDFGIRAIPALCLNDSNGKLLMTPYDFARATRAPDADLSKIIDNAITGKNKPTPAGTQATKPKNSD